MRLVVGLGNPGRQYTKTRHNIGFMVVDNIVAAANVAWEVRPSWQASVVKYKNVWYVKPLTFMNLSGVAIAAVSAYYKIPVAQVLVIYDDKDLPLGTVRFREQGSSGGHRGMQSIIEHLGTTNIARLKVGIAPAAEKLQMATADFVLTRFTKEEQKVLPDIITQTEQKLAEWLKTTK